MTGRPVRNQKIPRTLMVVGALALMGAVSAGAVQAAPGDTTRVSVDAAGAEVNFGGSDSSVSADGRFVAFVSSSDSLVTGDTNGRQDVFVHDRDTDADGVFDEAGAVSNELVSVSTAGAQVTRNTFEPSISADGNFVAFASDDPNLAGGDTGFIRDIFVRDRTADTTERVSVGSTGAEADYHSYDASISADGTVVAFASEASNLSPDDTDHARDIYVRDLTAGTTELVSVNRAGTSKQTTAGSTVPSISADGKYVAFRSFASNLVENDTNGLSDVFVRDLNAAATERMSVDSTGAEANNYSDLPSISADGKYVAFESGASNLVTGDDNGFPDVFVRDRSAGGATERVSVDPPDDLTGNSLDPSISADGHHVAFQRQRRNSGVNDGSDFQILVRDRTAGATELVSVNPQGNRGNNASRDPSISADGKYVAFGSDATDLVTGDSNGAEDVFVRERSDGAPPDTAPPTVFTVDPPTGKAGVSRTTNIKITFSEAMKTSTLNADTVTLVKAGTTTSIPVTMGPPTTDSSGRTVLTLDPFGPGTQKLGKKTTYKLTIEGANDTDGFAVEDSAGNELTDDYVSSFKTKRR